MTVAIVYKILMCMHAQYILHLVFEYTFTLIYVPLHHVQPPIPALTVGKPECTFTHILEDDCCILLANKKKYFLVHIAV